MVTCSPRARSAHAAAAPARPAPTISTSLVSSTILRLPLGPDCYPSALGATTEVRRPCRSSTGSLDFRKHKMGRIMAEAFPKFDLAGQTVLVTGAARGIGRACALACAQAGADVALGLRDAKAASGKQLVADIEALGRRALRLQMDVSRIEQIEPALAAAEAAFGRVDVLVNKDRK